MIPANARDALSAARLDVERAIIRLVTTAHGEQAVSLQPVFPGAVTRGQIADPLPGLWAARQVRSLAKAEVRRYARIAREAGRAWPQIGTALQVRDADYHTPGEAAFEYVADRLYDDPSLTWRCMAEGCGELIHDSGPYYSHPDEAERGHTSDCARRRALLQARQGDFDGGAGEGEG